VGTVISSLFNLCLHSYVLSGFGKLELVGGGSGERKKQQGGSSYEAGTYCVALDCNTEDKSPETWELTDNTMTRVAYSNSRGKAANQSKV
jgi:hypothetical protein